MTQDFEALITPEHISEFKRRQFLLPVTSYEVGSTMLVHSTTFLHHEKMMEIYFK